MNGMNGNTKYIIWGTVIIILVGLIAVMFISFYAKSDQAPVLIGTVVTILTLSTQQLVTYFKQQEQGDKLVHKADVIVGKADAAAVKAVVAADKADVAVVKAEETHKLVNSASEKSEKQHAEITELTKQVEYYRGKLEGRAEAKLEAALSAVVPATGAHAFAPNVSKEPVQVDLVKVADSIISKKPDA